MPPRLGRLVKRVRDGLAVNYGLLLVTASQLFFSLVNVSVKKLNSIDPPVPTFELIGFRMVRVRVGGGADGRLSGRW